MTACGRTVSVTCKPNHVCSGRALVHVMKAAEHGRRDYRARRRRLARPRPRGVALRRDVRAAGVVGAPWSKARAAGQARSAGRHRRGTPPRTRLAGGKRPPAAPWVGVHQRRHMGPWRADPGRRRGWSTSARPAAGGTIRRSRVFGRGGDSPQASVALSFSGNAANWMFGRAPPARCGKDGTFRRLRALHWAPAPAARGRAEGVPFSPERNGATSPTASPRRRRR